MKYMGSKRHLLNNGLGQVIREVGSKKKRFVDLFSGSGAVSWFASHELDAEVISVDLQRYSYYLSESVIGRTYPIDSEEIFAAWINNVEERRIKLAQWNIYNKLVKYSHEKNHTIQASRELCGDPSFTGLIWTAYGGHYFSPQQALTIDLLQSSLPKEEPFRTIALAALISAASDCAAAPGHTAQPFQPQRHGTKYIEEAWNRDPVDYVLRAIRDIAPRYAKKIGRALTADAHNVVSQVTEDDIVFLDPPYSDVHYSRFYHVLETIARGYCGSVSGVGRYPPSEERPTSSFSRKGQATPALYGILEMLAERKATAIVTFPERECSNKLSGEAIKKMAGQWFDIDAKVVNKKFSTLGGNASGSRPARQATGEMILTLHPK